MAPLRLLVAVAVAALLALPAAAASGGSVADLTASRLRSPDATFAGALAALEDVNGTGSFLLDAARVDVTVEQESSTLYASTASAPGGYQAAAPRQATHTGVTGATGLLHDGHYFDVFPLPGELAPPSVGRDSGCAALAPSSQDAVVPWEPKSSAIQDRHPRRADTHAALAWDRSSCPAPSWTVSGSFLAILYLSDATLNGTTYTSDHRVEATGPGVGPVNTTENRTFRYVYLAVHDGRMEIHGDPSVFLASADMRAGRLAFDDATGDVPALGGAHLAGEPVELVGDLRAQAVHAPGVAQSLQVKVTGRLDSRSVGGQSIAVASGGGPPPGLWLAALIALPVVAGGGAAAWRGGPARRLARLEQGLLRRDGPGASAAAARLAHRSRRLQRHADLHAEATAVRVDALAQAGHTTEALAEAAALGGWEGALATAYVHALRGDAPRAVEALRPWQEGNAAVLGAALRLPAFAAVRRHPEAARWLGADA